jgi:hypothetical protein
LASANVNFFPATLNRDRNLAQGVLAAEDLLKARRPLEARHRQARLLVLRQARAK